MEGKNYPEVVIHVVEDLRRQADLLMMLKMLGGRPVACYLDTDDFKIDISGNEKKD